MENESEAFEVGYGDALLRMSEAPDPFVELEEIPEDGISSDAPFVMGVTGHGLVSRRFLLHMRTERFACDVQRRLPVAPESDDGGYTFDYQAMTPEQRLKLMACAGIRCGARPTVVDRAMADKIDELANTPAGRERFKAELKASGLGDRQIEAAITRLASADEAIKSGKVKILEQEGWRDVAKDRMIDPNGEPVKPNHLGGITCDDYFMRDEIRALFTGLASRGK